MCKVGCALSNMKLEPYVKLTLPTVLYAMAATGITVLRAYSIV